MDGKPEFPPLLPDGFHPKTLDELEALCVDGFNLSTTRPTIMAGLRNMVQKLEAEGIEADLWVNGSFLTKKIDPEDADIALRISEAALVGAMPNQKAVLDWFRTTQTEQYSRCHCFMFCEVPAGHSWHPGFDVRQYWIDEYGKSRRNEPKGIVVLTIGGGCQ